MAAHVSLTKIHSSSDVLKIHFASVLFFYRWQYFFPFAHSGDYSSSWRQNFVIILTSCVLSRWIFHGSRTYWLNANASENKKHWVNGTCVRQPFEIQILRENRLTNKIFFIEFILSSGPQLMFSIFDILFFFGNQKIYWSVGQIFLLNLFYEVKLSTFWTSFSIFASKFSARWLRSGV